MFGFFLLEEIKTEANGYIGNTGKVDRRLFELGESLFNDLSRNEGFSSRDCLDLMLGCFASASESDGNYSQTEYEAFKIFMGSSGSEWTYSAFCNEMQRRSSYEECNRTIELSRRIKNPQIARRYILLAVVVALSDGPMNADEEMWCGSLCMSYVDHYKL